MQANSNTLKSLWPVYDQVKPLEYFNPPRAREMIERVYDEGFDRYTAPPDLWHNLSMIAAKVRHREAELDLLQAGLKEWPDDVDLLCDEFQLRITSHYDATRAEEIWQKLNTEMPRNRTGPYWRFWVYGAIYHAITLHDTKTAHALLDEGLGYVRRDGTMDILRNYRRILIDSAPEIDLPDEQSVRNYYTKVFDKLEKQYQLGIDLGVENAYVLATDLARLYQERAGTGTLGDGRDASQDSQPALVQSQYVSEAIRYLDLAEMLYTGNTNHPVWDIYEVRIRILMAEHRYGEALKLISSLPRARLNNDPSLLTMLRVASAMTGETPPQLVDLESEEGIQAAINKLLTEKDGMILAGIVRRNPDLARLLGSIAGLKSGSSERDEGILTQQSLISAIHFLFQDGGKALRDLVSDDPDLRYILERIIKDLENRGATA